MKYIYNIRTIMGCGIKTRARVCKQQATYLYIFNWHQYRLKQLYRENAIYYIPVTDATGICILLLLLL